MTLATWADASATWADTSATWAFPGVEDLTFKVEWSPTTAPGVTPTWVDITERLRKGRITRGRQSEFDRTSAGKFLGTLDNRDRTFDPSVSANAKPNKRIRVSVGSAPDTQVIFDGYLDALPQSYSGPADATVDFSATDAFKLLARFELDAIYGPIVEADAPYGWWRLADDLPRTTVVADSSGNDYHGTWKGTPRSGQSLVTDGPGSVSMKGSGDNIEGSADGAVITAPGSTVAAAPVTVECWVQTGKYGTNQSFICGQTHMVGTTTFINDFALTMSNSTGTARFEAQVGGINVTLTGSTAMRDTGVHHLVGTIDSSRNCRLYVDGALEAGPTTAGSTTTIDSSGSFRIGKPPVGADPGAGSSYKAWDGDICEVAVYSRALSAGEVLEHYVAGAVPWANDTTGTRVGRILDFVGWPAGDRAIDSGASSLGAAQNIEGKTALDHLLAVEQTEQGRFFIKGTGEAAFYSRNHVVGGTTEAEFADDEIDVMEFDFNESNMVNDCTVTRESGLPQRAQDATAIAAYWRMSESLSGLLYSTDNEARAMAEWRVANLKDPTLRPSALTFKPLINLPSLFPRVLARELGDRVSITKTLAGDDIEVDAVIEGISHDFAGGMRWLTSWNLSPLQYGQFGPGGGSGATYIKLDDATLGRLDNNNRLGF